MDDLISRQAAVNILAYGLDKIPMVNNTADEMIRRDERIICSQEIRTLPSEPRWIPVTEGLPKIDMSYPHHEDYLVQYDSGNMDVASWSNVNRFWTDHVTEPYWNCVQFAKVIAWMPLPDPWKGE